MDAFTEIAQAAQSFFSSLAQVSGGLVGLVFVAMTFNTRALGPQGDPVLKTLAQQTFSDFVMLLLVSLVMQIPHISLSSVGFSFLAICVVDTLRIGRNLMQLRQHLRGPGGGWRMLQRFALSALANVMIAWMSVELLRGDPHPDLTFSLLFSAVMMLLISGCRSAWLLVVQDMK